MIGNVTNLILGCCTGITKYKILLIIICLVISLLVTFLKSILFKKYYVRNIYKLIKHNINS